MAHMCLMGNKSGSLVSNGLYKPVVLTACILVSKSFSVSVTDHYVTCLKIDADNVIEKILVIKIRHGLQ